MKLPRSLAISLALAASTLSAHAGDVLIVLSGSDHLDLKDGKVFKTGFYLNELMQPVKALRDAGHEITFATPEGTVPSVDATSIDKMYFGGDEAAMNAAEAQLSELSLMSSEKSPVISLARVEQIGYDHYDAVYVPGGHAPMQDLLVSSELGNLLRYFHENGKTTALACHGPIALLSTLPDARGFVTQFETSGTAKAQTDWIYAGYKLTAFSNQEEEVAKGLLGGGEMKFYPQDALTRAGGQFSQADAAFSAHVVTDRELITGQNPASAPAVAQELLDRLK
ncbi:type 1 glutamine amidotransferase domain-containing protein [Neorhizobium galegae]|uniref:type 1 glutamine amidotransferase domain-containing protein n=1 Tax=Neorhizobium galegae TaxID=399 RepID=UPI000621145A|nr:type 1 glutamine amidotransferase domain-containing protein [Neorhizobium galegae]CDZ26537.1 Putative intracellular protease/amidase [Neorhizobium galegae bv. officinalis]KAA9383509.1 type 1 glutamine amidotransferase domain-containing protein [Neorhizobium galegae]MCM2500136.1 type 1 glutamine amidotransferase domain-containing protein [Neorhizobium galegae]MCQ1769724.1 type 1 glutamine amidotransferase domain-containing protein [Neorhizobium galegae]CDZ34842.1 Putative intracellular prote